MAIFRNSWEFSLSAALYFLVFSSLNSSHIVLSDLISVTSTKEILWALTAFSFIAPWTGNSSKLKRLTSSPAHSHLSGITVFHCLMSDVLETMISYVCPPFLSVSLRLEGKSVPGLPLRKLYGGDSLDNPFLLLFLFFLFLFLFSPSPLFSFELVGFLSTAKYQI